MANRSLIVSLVAVFLFVLSSCATSTDSVRSVDDASANGPDVHGWVAANRGGLYYYEGTTEIPEKSRPDTFDTILSISQTSEHLFVSGRIQADTGVFECSTTGDGCGLVHPFESKQAPRWVLFDEDRSGVGVSYDGTRLVQFEKNSRQPKADFDFESALGGTITALDVYFDTADPFRINIAATEDGNNQLRRCWTYSGSVADLECSVQSEGNDYDFPIVGISVDPNGTGWALEGSTTGGSSMQGDDYSLFPTNEFLAGPATYDDWDEPTAMSVVGPNLFVGGDDSGEFYWCRIDGAGHFTCSYVATPYNDFTSDLSFRAN